MQCVTVLHCSEWCGKQFPVEKNTWCVCSAGDWAPELTDPVSHGGSSTPHSQVRQRWDTRHILRDFGSEWSKGTLNGTLLKSAALSHEMCEYFESWKLLVHLFLSKKHRSPPGWSSALWSGGMGPVWESKEHQTSPEMEERGHSSLSPACWELGRAGAWQALV